MHASFILSDLFNQVWLINSGYAESFKPLVYSLLQGTKLEGSADFSKERESRQSYAIEAASSLRASRYSNYDEAPSGSIAIHNLIGPVIKRSEWCGPTGTMEISDNMKKADRHQNIGAHIFIIESGGGAANAIQPIIETMDQLTKPIIIYSEDVLASAAYGIAAHGDEIIVNHPNAIVGSIGTMMTIADWDGYFESLGLKIQNIYADASINKNRIFKEAIKGDHKGLKDQLLNPWNSWFINDIKTARAGKINKKSDIVFTGETFNADVALEKHGLIDHIGNFDFAIERASELMKTGRPNTSLASEQEEQDNPNLNLNMSLVNLNKFPKLSALANKPADQITAAALAAVNAELQSQNVNLEFISNDTLTEQITAATSPLTNQIATLSATSKKATDKLTAAVGLFKTNATDAEALDFDLNASITALQNADAGEKAKLKADEEKETGDDSDKPVPLSQMQR